MKFLDYLNEDTYKEDDLLEAVDILKDDCQPVIQLYRKNERMLCRFSYDYGPWIMKTKTPREDRQPKDTPKDVHEMFDKVFEKKFDWKPRSNGVFCWYLSNGYLKTSEYFAVFPIGNFKYIWSPKIDDLFAVWKVRLRCEEAGDNVSRRDWMKAVVDTYKDSNLEDNYSGEVMVKCNAYYLVRMNLLYKYLDNILGKQ